MKKRSILPYIIGILIIMGTFIYGYRSAMVISPFMSPDNISILSPNKGYYNSSSILLSVTVLESVSQINFSLNGVVSELCQNCASGERVVTVQDGNYNLVFYVYGSEGYATKNYNFYVDTSVPSVSYGSGTPGNDSYVVNSLVVRASLNDDNLDNVTYSFFRINETNNESILVKEVVSDSGLQEAFYNVTDDGLYSFNVRVIDKAGNGNSAETRIVHASFVCDPNWTLQNFCNSSDVNVSYYIDLNNCGELDGLPAGNGSIGVCDYCKTVWVQRNTTCVNDEIITYYADTNDCYSKTGLDSDKSTYVNRTSDCPSVTINNQVNNAQPNSSPVAPKKISLSSSQVHDGFYAFLVSNDIVEIDFMGKHVMRVNSITTGSLVLVLDSSTSIVFAGEDRSFDLNGDETNDLKITISNLAIGKASILIKEIIPVPIVNVTQEYIANETLGNVSEEGNDEVPKQVVYIIGGVVAVAVVLIFAIFAIILWFSYKNKNKEVELESKTDIRSKKTLKKGSKKK